MKLYVVCQEGGPSTLVTTDKETAQHHQKELGSWTWIDEHELDVINMDPPRAEEI